MTPDMLYGAVALILIQGVALLCVYAILRLTGAYDTLRDLWGAEE